MGDTEPVLCIYRRGAMVCCKECGCAQLRVERLDGPLFAREITGYFEVYHMVVIPISWMGVNETIYYKNGSTCSLQSIYILASVCHCGNCLVRYTVDNFIANFLAIKYATCIPSIYERCRAIIHMIRATWNSLQNEMRYYVIPSPYEYIVHVKSANTDQVPLPPPFHLRTLRRPCYFNTDIHRFLREHAKKSLREDKAFQRTLRAEARAHEDR